MTAKSFLATCCVLGSMTVAAGCESLGLGKDSSSSSRDRTSDRTSSRSDRDVGPGDVIGQDPYRNSGRTSDRTSTGSRGMSSIPTSAVKVDEGTDRRLTYVPEQSGRVYVYDKDDDRVIYTGRLMRSDRFQFDPRDAMTINGQPVTGTQNTLPSTRHQYQVYFQSERASQ
jgi:hypothetical protein